jgi:EpsD family peptidyl-prolyl cis-trans isomerase
MMKFGLTCTLGLALVIAACDRKPEGQSLAVVNGEEITSAELNADLSNAKLPDTLSKEDARLRVFEALIDRRLLAQQARADGLDKSPEYLNQERRMTENLLIDMMLGRKLNTSEVPSPDELSKFERSRPEMFAQREMWELNQLQFPTPKNAAVNSQITASKTFDELAKALTANNIQFKRGSTKVDTASLPHDSYSKIAALRPDQPFVVPGPVASVANLITARQARPVTGDQARSLALDAMRREQAAKILQEAVKSARAKAKIEYQKGYAPKK